MTNSCARCEVRGAGYTKYIFEKDPQRSIVCYNFTLSQPLNHPHERELTNLSAGDLLLLYPKKPIFFNRGVRKSLSRAIPRGT
jgi:hypothetical protein